MEAKRSRGRPAAFATITNTTHRLSRSVNQTKIRPLPATIRLLIPEITRKRGRKHFCSWISVADWRVMFNSLTLHRHRVSIHPRPVGASLREPSLVQETVSWLLSSQCRMLRPGVHCPHLISFYRYPGLAAHDVHQNPHAPIRRDGLDLGHEMGKGPLG